MQIHQILYSDRKSLGLRVDAEGRLIVRAPRDMCRAEILEHVRQKRDWIAKAQADMSRQKRERARIALIWGGQIPYLGKLYRLQRAARSTDAIQITDDALVLPPDMPPEAVLPWLRAQADLVLRRRLRHFARQMHLHPAGVRLSDARTRWGSCSAQGRLNFSWRLICCPPDMLDYIVVHELCHLKQLNHGSAFWAEVQAVLPDYPLRRAWFKRNAGYIHLFRAPTP